MNEFIATYNSSKKEIRFINAHQVLVDGIIHNYELEQVSEFIYMLRMDSKVFEFHTKKINEDFYSINSSVYNFDITIRTKLQEKALELLSIKNSLNHKTEIKAPMPGMILKIKKQPGDKVEHGDSVMILEAMKMENDLRSPASGIIKSINVKQGSAVEKGTVLFSVE
jgi:biotin carboxyl carrier protein